MSSATPESFTELRRGLKSIGASQSAGVLNCSPFESPYSVWAAIKHGVHKEESEAMRWGKRLEDVVASFYADSCGQTLRGDGTTIHQSPFWPWMHATPDRWRADGLLVEIKTAGDRTGWGAEHTDDVPGHYRVQAQHQMAVLNCDVMDIAVLIGNSDFRVYTVERDHEFCTQLVETLRDFHKNYIEGDLEPPVDFSHPASMQALFRLDKFDRTKEVAFDAQQGSLLADYLYLKDKERTAKKQADEVKAQILALLGDAAGATSPRHVAHRQVVSRAAYAVKASSYVRLDVHERKDKSE